MLATFELSNIEWLDPDEPVNTPPGALPSLESSFLKPCRLKLKRTLLICQTWWICIIRHGFESVSCGSRVHPWRRTITAPAGRRVPAGEVG